MENSNVPQVFQNEQFGSVRIVIINDEPWFVGKDVADALGYTNSRKALADHVDDEDKGVTICYTPGGKQEVTVINESGVYALVFSSKLPAAKHFKHWVTSEILPSIRKHGVYTTQEFADRAIADPDWAIQIFTALKEERQKTAELSSANMALTAKIEEDKPKVYFANAVACATNSIHIGDLAKLIKQTGTSIGQNRLFAWLRSENYLIKQHGISWNMPTQYAMDLGLFEVKETVTTMPDGSTRINRTTMVTGKGQAYFLNKFSGDPFK